MGLVIVLRLVNKCILVSHPWPWQRRRDLNRDSLFLSHKVEWSAITDRALLGLLCHSVLGLCQTAHFGPHARAQQGSGGGPEQTEQKRRSTRARLRERVVSSPFLLSEQSRLTAGLRKAPGRPIAPCLQEPNRSQPTCQEVMRAQGISRVKTGLECCRRIPGIFSSWPGPWGSWNEVRSSTSTETRQDEPACSGGRKTRSIKPRAPAPPGRGHMTGKTAAPRQGGPRGYAVPLKIFNLRIETACGSVLK
ncbi:hypothetical protein SKAU_G00337730 [Synaphobranchus kaupii]|uniref:Uncharacterized protein n=1 Tax=Synaphobranchus kaupii TaxID=118154 RepID=A0A9Q1EMJ9_SYNKA|nr:hypothetical protein SKAU_G00337730 [Synaphobranchus kaupii]